MKDTTNKIAKLTYSRLIKRETTDKVLKISTFAIAVKLEAKIMLN